MTLDLTWTDAALRIFLTMLAGAAIGFERSEKGHTAGLRTTLLVALAACLAMLQANWLINTAGKAADSFITLDLMRLPLGILSGVGFIGAGAILRRGNLVLGLTTASTLWFVTVIGLCFGGGQIGLGIAGAILGIFIVSALKIVEGRMRQERIAELIVRWREGSIDETEILTLIAEAGLRISRMSARYCDAGNTREFRLSLVCTASINEHGMPVGLHRLARKAGILELAWTM